MIKKLLHLIKKIYLNKNYSFLRKNIIFFYEFGCFLQKKKLNFFADIIFSTPYYFISFFGLKNISFDKACYLFNSDKSLITDLKEKNSDLEFSLADNYERYFFRIRNKKLKILEIGIGGHNATHLGGCSVRALCKYFKRSMIFGIDIVDKNEHQRKRIKTFKGSQIDKNFLEQIASKHGPFDIIIDDGSHYVEHQNFSFYFLFEHLKNEGIYIIEDMPSSYVKYMGGSTNIDDEINLVKKFSKFSHNVYSEYIFPEELKKLNENIQISSIQFYSKCSRGSILLEKSNVKKNITINNPEFKYTNEEILKFNPNHRHNKKSSLGIISNNKLNKDKEN